MFINERADLFPTPSAPSVSGVAPVDIDNTPLSPGGMIAIKIYAFGGLAFMICVILAAIGYWTWTVVIKREYADSPGWLDLHPERMREREKARIARLKAIKEERMLEKKRKEENKFSPPPLRYERKERRDRSCSLPIKPALRHPSVATFNPQDRKSSLSTKPPKAKRVSWASSMATLDVNGNTSEKPLLQGRESPAGSIKSPFYPIPSYDNPLSPIPKARTSTPRLSTSVEPRSRRGQEMIAATTPETAISWAKPVDPFASS